jgi:hypothetical protein
VSWLAIDIGVLAHGVSRSGAWNFLSSKWPCALTLCSLWLGKPLGKSEFEIIVLLVVDCPQGMLVESF